MISHDKVPNNEVQQAKWLGSHFKKILPSDMVFEVIYDDGAVIVNVKSDERGADVEEIIAKAMQSYKNYSRVGDGFQEGGYWLNVVGSNGQHYGVEL